ncbi:MAG: hypothetical protein RLY97_1500, partial [Pseudomonadota bacterium]
RIAQGALGPIAALRLNDMLVFAQPNAKIIQGSYADSDVREQLIDGGVDVLFHLASLPGAASEIDPVLGKHINLDGSIALLDTVAAIGVPRVVYASSIAALGRTDSLVTDDTALRPIGSYGTHKAMIELYLADLTRRGVVDGRAVRPAGIVARPRNAYAGFATAWMSDVFHAALEQRDITIPLPSKAHIWLQSIDAVADNIIHAAKMPTLGLSSHRAWTLPATVVCIETLVQALRGRTGYNLRAEYGDGLADHKPLDASAALALGFVSDGDTNGLVNAVISRITKDRAMSSKQYRLPNLIPAPQSDR